MFLFQTISLLVSRLFYSLLLFVSLNIMGAGQIGGIATLLDIDFNNAAGFIGVPAEITEAQFIVHYLSHAMMFCAGALIEPHVVLTPAICVFGERYKFEIFAGTHKFLEFTGAQRYVQNLCIHKGYNHTARWHKCSYNNIALLVLNKQFSLRNREPGADYIINRIRYGVPAPRDVATSAEINCRFYGWGSRRNGYLIPLLISLQRVDVTLLSSDQCDPMWRYEEKYLCIRQPRCKSEKFGALCPDDIGSIVVCGGYAQGMMTSRLVDRPCGVGFLDLSNYNKFLTCGVDDSRDVLDHDASMSYDFTTPKQQTPSLITPPPMNLSTIST